MSEKEKKPKIVRQPTAIEKEAQNTPSCLWDPLDNSPCLHHTYPPPCKACEDCLVESISSCLEDEVSSETMRWFIAYRKFVKA